jgi:hypothetical protein
MSDMSLARVLLSAALLAGCGDGGGFPDAPPIDSPPAPGTFSLQWALEDTSGNPITCEEISAQAVTVTTRNRAVQGGSTEVFVCSTLSGTSQPLAPGTYDMDFELDGPSSIGVLAMSPKQMGVVIPAGNNVALMPIKLTVNNTGGIKLKISANKPGHNCGSPANLSMPGAGITGMTLALQHSGSGTCEPVTFTYAANATLPGGSYTVNCTSPTVAPCIEDDQELSVTGVKSGNYQLHIRGKVGANDCWTNDDSLPVPPLGMDVSRTLNLAMAPGC